MLTYQPVDAPIAMAASHNSVPLMPHWTPYPRVTHTSAYAPRSVLGLAWGHLPLGVTARRRRCRWCRCLRRRVASRVAVRW